MVNMEFELKRVVVTIGVADRIINDSGFSNFLLTSFGRYIHGDWGELEEEDKERNDEAVECGERIMAAYIYPKDETKIWIITEADRSVTTILFPHEY